MRLAVAVLAASLLGGAASAQMVSAAEPDSVASAIQDAGYRANLTVDRVGDPMVETSMGGYKVQVIFYDCTANRDCQSLQFSAGFDRSQPMDPARALAFAHAYRYAAVSLDEEGDPFVTWDVITGPGIPQETFQASVAEFDAVVGSFGDFVFANDTVDADEPAGEVISL